VRRGGHPGRRRAQPGGGAVIALLIALGAAVGAPARYLTDRTVQARHDTLFPWGTLVVNVVASFVLGVLVGWPDLSPRVLALVGTGFCGALSTFSTFSYETVRLVEERARFYALANVAVSLAAGLGAAAFGWSIGTTLG
jgi:CrcB protein